MDRGHQLLLDIWQDVSRHLDIGESTETIATRICEHMPLRSLVVREVDAEHRRTRIAAIWPAGSGESAFGDVELSLAEWRRLTPWLKQGVPLHVAADGKKAERVFELLQRPVPNGDWLLAPLAGEHGSQGVLVAIANEGHKFSKHHAGQIAGLQEPLSVALDNDARLHELAALREAAEAERQSLLRRLGRSDVGDVIVGDQSGLAQVMQRVDLVSRSEVPVLILGETGTGKELVARAIHNRSDRHDGPFMRVNCGAIPRELIDSQLFGHEKGAFTGANETRQGWFERADMGTLFLDEIGELPLDAQVRFLRVLQDGFVERVGGSKPIHVNVRVVAATHRDLAGMATEGSFREDLWYRIAVFPILLPPLRERTEDIPALARHFALRAATRFGLAPVEPSDADIELLQSYDWPGNIRELGAVIDRAAILGDGDSLELAAALGPATSRNTRTAISSTGPNMSAGGAGTAILPLNDAMRGHIEAALQAAQGRIEGPYGIAKMLKINPHTSRGAVRLGIDWKRFRRPAAGS